MVGIVNSPSPETNEEKENLILTQANYNITV